MNNLFLESLCHQLWSKSPKGRGSFSSNYFRASITIFVLLSFLIVKGLSAQDDSLRMHIFPVVEVTSTKIETLQKNLPKNSRIISREEIEKSAGMDLTQILNIQLGMQVVGSNANPGINKEIYLRGANTQYALILLDGAPLTDASGVGGAFDLRLIDPQNIERIEILYGSQSVLYGADAVSGVINIVSRKTKQPGLNLSGEAGAGSFQSFKKGLSAYYRTQNSITVGASYNSFETTGISEALSKEDQIEFRADPFERQNTSASVQYHGKEFRLGMRYNHALNEGQYDDGPFKDGENNYNSEAHILSTQLRLGREDVSLHLNQLINRSDRNFESSIGDFRYRGLQLNTDVYLVYSFKKYVQSIFGVQDQRYEMDPIENSELFLLEKKSTNPYMNLLIKHPNGFNASLGGRAVLSSVFGEHLVYNAAFSYAFPGNYKASVSYGTSFKAPNLDQLFGGFGPNPDLQPEQARNFEGGVEWENKKNLFAEAAIFHREISDVIVYQFTTGYENRDNQTQKGLELSLGFQHPKSSFSTRLNYQFLMGDLITEGSDGSDSIINNLYRRPKHRMNLILDYSPIPKLNMRFNLASVGERSDLFFDPLSFESSTQIMPSYFLADLHLNFKMQDGGVLYLSLKNLLNTKFSESFGYSTPGINLMMGCRFNIHTLAGI